ncbi:ribonuclease H-like protein [Nemania sp. NC0429]|nr:ribonuclease H-like protein [Nemania sp. NC0429]
MPRRLHFPQGLMPRGPGGINDEEGPSVFVYAGGCQIFCIQHEGEDGVQDVGTEARYEELSHETRAEIDSRCSPLRSPHPLSVEAHGVSIEADDAEKRYVFPTKFNPSPGHATPAKLFPGKLTSTHLSRYIHRHDQGMALAFADGACLNNGKPNPKAGWAFVHGPGFAGQPAHIASGRLENKGPLGGPSIQSNNRAELRAVIAALQFRGWNSDGVHTLVIATDSEYVAIGSTEWAISWVRDGWRRAGQEIVKNQDLWEILLDEVKRLDGEGLRIQL